MNNRVARFKWIMVLMLVLAWKYQQTGNLWTDKVPLARIAFHQVKKLHARIESANSIQDECKVQQRDDEMKETHAVFTLLRF